MNLSTILSDINGWAALLLLIFYVPNRKKISVSLGTFIILLIITCAIFWIISSKENSQTANIPASEIDAEDDYSDDNPRDSSTDIPVDDGTVKANVLQVAPLTNSTRKIDSIMPMQSEVSPIEIISVSGEIYERDQRIDYEFVPQISGTHRFEFSDVPNGTDLRLEICNSGGERIMSNFNLDDGDGLTVPLDAGKTYCLRVGQYNNLGTYTLNMGVKKPITDISNVTTVSDSIQYTAQQNDYSFTAKWSGVHRFEFSDVPDGTDLRLEVFNSGWERIDSNYNLDNGDGLTVFLDAGETYYLRVGQYNNLGTYTLNVGTKKPIADISDVTAVSDSIQYTGQQNDYSFSASLSGVYRFEFSDVPDGTDLRLEVFNSGWERIDSNYNLDNGDGLTVSLDAGKTYYLRVGQYNNLGIYTLNVGAKKPITDISDVTAVSDSIQYTGQQNDYSFSVDMSGTYRFEFSDVSDGTNLWLGIYNSGWERIDSGSSLHNGDGLIVSLSSNKEYFVRVAYYYGYNSYTLNINREGE